MLPRNGRAEGPFDEVRRNAGMVLCAFAGVPYTHDAAKGLADAWRNGRFEEFDNDTFLRLLVAEALIGFERMAEIIADILD